jgi:hypothetical protein
VPASANKSYASYRDLGEKMFNAYAKSAMPQLHVTPLIAVLGDPQSFAKSLQREEALLVSAVEITNMIIFESPQFQI